MSGLVVELKSIPGLDRMMAFLSSSPVVNDMLSSLSNGSGERGRHRARWCFRDTHMELCFSSLRQLAIFCMSPTLMTMGMMTDEQCDWRGEVEFSNAAAGQRASAKMWENCASRATHPEHAARFHNYSPSLSPPHSAFILLHHRMFQSGCLQGSYYTGTQQSFGADFKAEMQAFDSFKVLGSR
jgi:hypothetical protein